MRGLTLLLELEISLLDSRMGLREWSVHHQFQACHENKELH